MDDHTVARGDKYQDKLESTVYNSFGLGLTRDTRATVDQVLDPKTVEVLLKLQKQAIFGELAGCISTGKEANVYFGVNEDGSNVAVKVYKTSILGFRDRDEYVDGEYRFRHGYCKSNPRKMVSLWAEKEQRNLIRLRNAGIHCPSVLKCTRNVLVMSLVGVPGRAAPRLKDVSREPSIGWLGVYLDVIRSMRKMFQMCKLVHGDLSEYNMLLDDSDKVFVIDVSQSVGLDHPRSLEFLKRDCFNINAFFERLVPTIPLQELFRFIVTPVFKDHQDQTLSASAKVHLPSKDQTLSGSEEARLSFLLENRDSILSPQIDDSVFLQTWVPSSLAEAGDLFEIERIMQERSQGLGSVYDTLLNTPEKVQEEDEGDDDDDDDDDDDEDCSEDSLSDGVSSSSEESPNGCDGHRPDNMTKHEWKKLVKEQNREKRKNKVSKYRKQKRNLKKYGCK